MEDQVKTATEVQILLAQHIGVPAKAVVKTGQRVSAGEIVGEAKEGLSVNIHASVSGVVREVTDSYIMIKAE